MISLSPLAIPRLKNSAIIPSEIGFTKDKDTPSDASFLASGIASNDSMSPRSSIMPTPADHLLERKLLHHFLSSQTLLRLMGALDLTQARSQDACAKWVWNAAVQNTGLMDALLGYSAFSLRRLQPNDKGLLYASHRYMTQAITAHTGELGRGISDDNAEVVFAGGLVIAIIAVSSHEYLGSETEEGLPLHWFQPWQGVRTIAKNSMKYFRTEEIKSLMDIERNTFQIYRLRAQHSYGQFEFLLDDLDRDATSSETLLAYESSVSWLSVVYEQPESDLVFKFAAKVRPRFVQLLAQDDPRTLTVVGYFFMLLKTTKQAWWLPRSTATEFKILMKRLPDEWKPRMQWAVREFEG